MSRSLDEHPLRWDIAEEHLDEAAFLASQWRNSLVSPLYTLDEVAAGPEGRLLAHVDALVLGGTRVAQRLLLPRLASESEDEVFAAGLALLGMGEDRGDALLELLLTGEPHQRAGLRRAFLLGSRPDVGPLLEAALARAEPAARASLLDLLAAWNLPPASRLDALLDSDEPELVCAALRAARRFPSLLEAASVRRALAAEAPEVRSIALETGLVLGLPDAWRVCEAAIARPAEDWGTVAQAWALGASGAELGPLLQGLESPGTRHAALWALGVSGRPAAVDALLAAMRDVRVAPLAAEAFVAITGLVLEPEFVLPPEDSEEAGEDSGAEADLPRPDAARIARWWAEARPRFKDTERYLFGQPWSVERILGLLDVVPMRRRPVLALELAIRTGGRFQLDTECFAAQQRRDVERLRGGLGRVPAGPFKEWMRGGASPPANPVRAEQAARVVAPARTPGALVVTGLGMVTAIGHGAVESCASLRARVVKPWPLAFQVLRSDEPAAATVTGHPLRGLVDGFTGLTRLLKLGALALEDLVRSAELPVRNAAFLQQTALLLCLAPTRREEWDFYDELLAEQLPPRLLQLTGLAIPARNVTVVQTGHAAGLSALQQGARLLQEGRFQRALVLGMDSLVEDDALRWLASQDRLKTPEHPMGLMPGEAAAAVLLENGTEATRREASVLGALAGVGTARAERAERKGPESARALAQAIRQAWPAGATVADVYGDLTGENDRALEWGFAQVLLRETHRLDATHIHAPAECLGDTGAASGLIAVGAVLRAFARGYAHGDQALVWSSSDSGELAAARLSRS